MKPRPTVQVPASITNYKNGKKGVIDTVSRNTAILQGETPGANTPLGVVRELGARADAGTVYKAKVLQRFMVPFTKLIVSRIVQFYTEDRKYRILGDQKASIEKKIAEEVKKIANMPQGTPPEQQMQAMIQLLMFAKEQSQNTSRERTATFNRRMLVRDWERDVEVSVDETTGVETRKPMKEEFIPEFDIAVNIVKEQPTDRNYYINYTVNLLGKAMGPKAFWTTMETGKFPSTDEILAELGEMQKAQAEAAQSAMARETEENEKDRQSGIAKQQATNESQIIMTAIAKDRGMR